MPTASCSHKPHIGCALTALPVCCSCADQRPVSRDGYPDYVDGVGMTMTSKRWTKYCTRCRDYWHREQSSELIHQDPWSFPPRPLTSAAPHAGPRTRLRRERRDRALTYRPAEAPPGVQVRGSRPTNGPRPQSSDSHQPPTSPADQPQPLAPNPFGTREELSSEDWESPLTSMFTRAYTRYRDAEANRRQLEREIQDSMLRDATEEHGPAYNQLVSSQSTGYDQQVPSQNSRYVDDLGTNFVARNIVSSMLREHRNPGRQRNSPSQPMDNPINAQPRPPALTAAEMTVSIACRICNEQTVDTLIEPCMHAAICHWCSEIIQSQAQRSRRRPVDSFGELQDDGGSQQWRCPICRRDITSVRKIYLA
jgi:Zinc finger, C3HC4 type (RING finger)